MLNKKSSYFTRYCSKIWCNLNRTTFAHLLQLKVLTSAHCALHHWIEQLSGYIFIFCWPHKCLNWLNYSAQLGARQKTWLGFINTAAHCSVHGCDTWFYIGTTAVHPRNLYWCKEWHWRTSKCQWGSKMYLKYDKNHWVEKISCSKIPDKIIPWILFLLCISENMGSYKNF